MSVLKSGPLSCVLNRGPVRGVAYAGEGRADILSLSALALAERNITGWPDYAPTPLVSLPGLATAAGIGAIHYKDEGGRFGLGSFKALGGAYAVQRLLQEKLADHAASADGAITALSLSDIAKLITVTCATDGNHGKSVAWGARTFGCACVIYVHEGVSQARRDAISAYGAEVREVKGTYDDAVRQAAKDAEINSWSVVSDTSYPGYTDVPRNVMQGYGLIAQEALNQLPAGVLPTHVFIQGGVGGVAASICSYFWEKYGNDAPVFVVVEPDKADCLQLSAKAGIPTSASGALDTIMAGLACGEVSLLAWSILSPGTDAFLTVPDEAAAETMRLLADAPYGDPAIVAGESAVAGLAGLLLAAGDEAARSALNLGADSVALLVGTEGATDPDLYAQITGRRPQDVLDAVVQKGAQDDL